VDHPEKSPHCEQLEAQASAFAHLLGLAPDDLDGAYRRAIALGEGLFPHQIEGVAFLIGRRRAILADDMGLGKTRQAIVSLRHVTPGGPYLVVCPASVKRNWAREIEQAVPGSSVRVVEGSTTPVAGSEWTIVNYDILSKHVGALGRVPWAGLVFDEAHYLKNHTSARSRIARQLAEQASTSATPAPAVYLLTGTPLTNRPRDLFVLLQLVGHSLGRSFLSFAKRYCAAEKTEYGWKTDGASNLEELTVQLHGVMMRRSKDQVLALPPKLRTWLPVDVPSGTGAREIREVVDLLIGQRAAPAGDPGAIDDGRTRTHVLALLTKARQRLAGAKVGATSDLVSGAIEQGEKVIVFSCFEEPLQALATDFGDAAVLLTGRTPAHKRQGLVDRFQQDETIRVFLANIIAGGVGLNLTAASQVVFNDLDWVPANHWQAEDRAYRIGQTRTVNVTYLIGSGTVDDFVQTVLETKAALVNAIVDGEALTSDLSRSVLDELQRALRAISPGLADTPGRIVDDELIERLLREASDRLRTTQEPSPEVEASRRPENIDALRRALEALARVLSGPSVTHYRIASTSHPGLDYVIAADGTDVTCSCPGFEYRGQCRHARDVKAALATGKAVPAAYVLENAV
jgi:SWI/SNF-related matrix-associated actin-dependent regulator of chromatin subfamily A-like protein 1